MSYSLHTGDPIEKKAIEMKMARLDQSDMHGSIGSIPDQMEAAWEAMAGRTFPDACRNVHHVVVAGMGGSALGAHLIQDVFRDRLRVPVTIVSDYAAPSWIDERTLIVLSSYSGGTEEVMAVAEHGLSRGVPMIALTTGGDLEAFAGRHGLPSVVFGSELNTCGQPRIGLGYAVTYLLAMFRQLGFVALAESEVTSALMLLRETNPDYAAPGEENPAYELARATRGKSILIMASEHLTGNAHILANQWNENAKNLAVWFAIPELNHHLLEGMTHPAEHRDGLAAVLIQSGMYDPRNRRRHEITRTLLEKQGIACSVVTPRGETALEQACDLLLLGTYASFYQALMNDTDPSPIPWVDQFKRLMAT
ncbi:MAG: hypothetical protein OXO51_17445 [Gemmatimonadota bacterium]|nr:hypothetical protein [Gemmatimonadota bacterium]